MKVSRRDNLDRYYLFSRWGFALFLHHVHHDEEPDLYHSHPWSGLSFIFGRYREQRFGEKPKCRWGFHWVPARRHHRVDLPWGPVWTLFFHLRRSNRWEVMDDTGEVISIEPWRAIGGPTSYRPVNHGGG